MKPLIKIEELVMPRSGIGVGVELVRLVCGPIGMGELSWNGMSKPKPLALAMCKLKLKLVP